jgi:hypothetical protein
MARHTVSILKVETYFMHVVQCVLQKAHGVALPAVNSEQSPGSVDWGVDTMCIALSLTVNASLVPGDAALFEPHSVVYRGRSRAGFLTRSRALSRDLV